MVALFAQQRKNLNKAIAGSSILYIIYSVPDETLQPVRTLVRKEGLRENVTKHLLIAIFSGQIKSGDRLVAQTLATQLGVSATPVREALVELAAIGLIEILPNRGAVCLPFGVRELREIYQLRRVLEVESTKLACGRIPSEKLRDLRIGMAKLAEVQSADWSERAMKQDTTFHDLIQSHCGNNRLCHELERYKDLMASIRHVVGDKCRVQLRAVEQHIQIIDALIESDAEQACQRMASHIDSTARGVERVMFADAR